MTDGADRFRPWTIKNLPTEERNAAIAAAERADQPMGEWLARAIRNQVQADHQANRPPVVLPQPAHVDPAAHLDTIERLVALAMQTATLSPGTAPPPSVTRLIYGLVRDRLRDSRKPGQTPPMPRQTAEVG